ncbi:MAG: hypothetical protein JSW37_14205, partial [Anaerolineales bacterium]
MWATRGITWCQYAGLVVALVIGLAVKGCNRSRAPDSGSAAMPMGEWEMPAGDILQVLEKHEGELMDIPGVVGLGIGQSETTA